MKAFILSWLSGDESEVDSVIVAGVLALLALIACTIASLILVPSTFSPVTFGTGAVGIIGAIGGSKRFRDGPKQ